MLEEVFNLETQQLPGKKKELNVQNMWTQKHLELHRYLESQTQKS